MLFEMIISVLGLYLLVWSVKQAYSRFKPYVIMLISTLDEFDAPWSTPQRIRDEEPTCPTCGGHDLIEEGGSAHCNECGDFFFDADVIYDIDYTKRPL